MTVNQVLKQALSRALLAREVEKYYYYYDYCIEETTTGE
jgi:hypothetical protein